ncbi:methyl-accepting chemotaxis protein [Thiospirochaeta perfilievii]|uniref:histidine kinase n=1 Tax=Thiospirochaeta perfilievii TaxID=252967 RepID=A0A5C1QD51_9SPIO|nr:cache domain-containing protein [Thiospirochaeta perfilievii]QEN04644.1 methyl-accepting chemotaxis protein [Thiospirochaeta perfilievii]
MKIKTKLFVSIGGSLIILLALSFEILMLLTSNTITLKLNDQLKNQVGNVTNQVSDLITTSARSYLRAIGEKSNSISNEYYSQFERGEISFDQAYSRSLKSVSQFKFLGSGIVFITDEKGIIISHPNPKREGTIAPMQAWIQRLKPDESTYKFYEFQSKNKLVFRVYNPNFKYNICVDANTLEFLEAVDLEELNKTINGVKIGLTGYPIIMSKEGVIITNPNKELINTVADDNFTRVLSKDSGFYKFVGSDGSTKFVSFRLEKNSNLYICLYGSVSEFYDTVDIIKRSVYWLGLIVLIILGVLIFVVLSTITIPIKTFTNNLDDVVHGQGDLTKRIKLTSRDEIGLMVKLFNSFLNTIQDIIIEIKSSVQASINIRSHIVYRINETFAAVKKILVNIVSIKNQAKQLDSKVLRSAEAAKEINRSIHDLNKSIFDQKSIINTATSGVTSMIESFKDIELFIGESKDNILRIISHVSDDKSIKYLEESIKLFDRIKKQTHTLNSEGQDIILKVEQLKISSDNIAEKSYGIKKEADSVENIMDDSKNIANYVVESMDIITGMAKKISNSMERLERNTIDLEESGESLRKSVNRFKT